MKAPDTLAEIWKAIESDMGSTQDTSQGLRFDEVAATSQPDGAVLVETEFLFVGVDEATEFTYEVPSNLRDELRVGQRVRVPVCRERADLCIEVVV